MPQPVIPDEVIFDRAPVLTRALQGLPDEMLTAMVAGIEAHADDLVPGRLYGESTDGGCAVGVMLRELHPRHGLGRLRFRLRERNAWGVGAYPKLAMRYPRLRHVELAFDTTIERTLETSPELSERDAARAAGIWFSSEAQAELARRRWTTGAGDHGPSAPVAALR
ncbi:MAG: hypothetical protein M3383_08815 [Actinomycetota bacterium]|nr:hypothetical protein [Actinomycetota bacterium]